MIKEFLARVFNPIGVIQKNIKTTGNVVGGSLYVSSSKSESNISINGVSYSGRSIEVRNGAVYIDGKSVNAARNAPAVTIEVTGSCESIKADICNTVTVNGNCGRVDVSHGDVSVSGEVTGNATTQMGDITAKKISGNATTMMGSISK